MKSSAKEMIKGGINRVAETHFYIKPILVNVLKKQILDEKVKENMFNSNTYYEYWTKTLNDRFYDMGTLIRLATEIENGLKWYYIEKRWYETLVDLNNDKSYREGIFQRFSQTKAKGMSNVIELFITQLDYDLNNNTKLESIQELMLCRHLYAHNTGIIDLKFINSYKKLKGVDITDIKEIKEKYPKEDVYFFEPLKKISEFIEDSRRFIFELP